MLKVQTGTGVVGLGPGTGGRHSVGPPSAQPGQGPGGPQTRRRPARAPGAGSCVPPPPRNCCLLPAGLNARGAFPGELWGMQWQPPPPQTGVQGPQGLPEVRGPCRRGGPRPGGCGWLISQSQFTCLENGVQVWLSRLGRLSWGDMGLMVALGGHCILQSLVTQPVLGQSEHPEPRTALPGGGTGPHVLPGPTAVRPRGARPSPSAPGVVVRGTRCWAASVRVACPPPAPRNASWPRASVLRAGAEPPAGPGPPVPEARRPRHRCHLAFFLFNGHPSTSS